MNTRTIYVSGLISFIGAFGFARSCGQQSYEMSWWSALGVACVTITFWRIAVLMKI